MSSAGHDVAEVKAYLTAFFALSAITVTGAIAVTILSLVSIRKSSDPSRSSADWVRVAAILFLLCSIFFALTYRSPYLRRFDVLINDTDHSPYGESNSLIQTLATLQRAASFMAIASSFLNNLVQIIVFVLVFHVGLDAVATAGQARGITYRNILKLLRIPVWVVCAALAAVDVAHFGVSLNTTSTFFKLYDADAGVLSGSMYKQQKQRLESWRMSAALLIIFLVFGALLLVWSAVAMIMSRGARKLSSIAVLVSALLYVLQAAYSIAYVLLWFNFRTGIRDNDMPKYIDITTVILGDWPLLLILASASIVLRKGKGGLRS